MQNRTVFFQKTIYYITWIIFVMSTIAGWFGITADCTTIKLRTLKTEQEITGWGTSAAWWAQMVEDADTADEYAKLLYSDEGLGLNVYRYNVGGGEKDNPNARLWNLSSRSTESFLKEFNEETGEMVYDWSKDANAQQMLDACLKYGNIDTVVLFANSAPWQMTKSLSAAGSYEDLTCNLREDCYDDFANYMLDVAEYFISKGVPVKYISPINEPEWSWGGGWVGQEGCHYDLDEVIAVAKVFAKEIKARGLDVKLSMLESGQLSIDGGHYNLDGIEALYADEEIKSVMGTYSYHSYWTDGDFLLKAAYGKYLDKAFPDVEVEMSEWCELPNAHKIYDIEAAVIMARTIGEDLSLSGVNSWSSWVAVNDGGENADSMIAVDGDYNEYTVGKRYYAMAHYTKFIPVGSYAIDFGLSVADVKSEKAWWKQNIDGKEYPVYLTENNMTVSAYVTPDDDYVVVIVNEGEEKDIRFSGMMFRDMQVYTTDADSNLELTAEEEVGMKKITVGTNTVTTVVFSK